MKKTIIALFFTAAAFTAGAQENYTYNLGETRLVLLSEGQGQGKTSILVGATPEMLATTAPGGTFPNAINAFLLETPAKVILIDAGLGRKLSGNLDAAGVTPDKVDMILLTHTHGDHIGGLVKDGEAVFKKATVYLSQAEYDRVKQGGNAAAKTVLDVYGKRITTFIPSAITDTGSAPLLDEVKPQMPGIMAIDIPGHTPGHAGFLIYHYDIKVLVWGDVTHAMAVQMPYPQVSATYDTDPVLAAKSRLAILDYCADHKVHIAGMHIPYPGMGTVAKKGNGYIFTPME